MLPNSISKLTALTTLWLDVNHLDLRTPAISFCTRLKSLKLNLNRLTTLPPEMCRLADVGAEGPALEGECKCKGHCMLYCAAAAMHCSINTL